MPGKSLSEKLEVVVNRGCFFVQHLEINNGNHTKTAEGKQGILET